MNYQNAKKLVLDYYAALDGAGPDGAGSALERYLSPDVIWRGFHPFGEIHGNPAGIGQTVWTPLKTSLTRMQRRMDIFFAGNNSLTDEGLSLIHI